MLCARAPCSRVREVNKVKGNEWTSGRAFFYRSLIFTIMDKFKSLITSKKFWTLIASIVAALAAFFTVSCSASAKMQRSGVHIDTVRVDYIIRSRNIQTF